MDKKIVNQNPFLEGVVVQDKEYAIQRLKEVLKKGDTLFTQLEHVSKSGMTRHIKVRQLEKDRALNWSYLVSLVVGWRISNKTNGIVVGGCGMDMGFHLIYTLSSILFDDGYALKHEWL